MNNLINTLKWLVIMPLIWVMDYIYGIFNLEFRDVYLAVQENIAKYMAEEIKEMQK